MVSRTYDKNTPDDCGESVFGGCRGGNSGCQNSQQQPESGNAAFGEGKTSHAAPEQGRYGRPERHSSLGAVLPEAKSACPAAGLQDRKGHQAIYPDGTQPAAETADGKTGKSRHCRCTDSPDDCRDSKRGKIFIHQSHGTVQKGKSGRPSGCHPYETMGENRRPDGIAGYARGSLAEVR